MTRVTGLVSLALAALPLIVIPQPASAQLKVYDAKNHIENILSALRAFIQIQNQLTMLTGQQGGIDRFAAQALIGQAIQIVGQLASLTNAYGDRPLYDGVYGPLAPGQLGPDISDSWNQPRAVGHATASNSYAVLRQQLLQSQRQMQQVQTNLANSNSQVGIVGSVQSATEMLGTLGDQLNTLQLVSAQQLRIQAAQESRALQEKERALAAYELQSAPLQITLPPSKLRGLFE